MSTTAIDKQTQTIAEDVPVTVIKPSKGWVSVDFGEIWRYRELFGFMVWRDIKVRYKQTVLGFLWAIIGPLISTLIFSIIFKKVGKIETDGLPAPIFFMIGLMIWKYFATGFGAASNSLTSNGALLTKIYIPRLILPIAPLFTNLVDFFITFVVFLLLLAYYETLPAITIVFIPFLLLLTMIASLGLGLFFAALNVRYRDVRQIVPFITQLWMYVTIIVPFSAVPGLLTEKYDHLKYLYGLNPMAGIVEAFRWCLANHKMGEAAVFQWQLLLIGTVVSIIMLFVGLAAFKRMERQFADIV